MTKLPCFRCASFRCASFILSVSACVSVQAAPFLTANPYLPDERQPTKFELTFDGSVTPVVSPAVLCDEASVIAKKCAVANSSVILHHDLAVLSKAKHSVAAKACDDVECSEASPLFTFTTVAFRAPGGVRIKP